MSAVWLAPRACSVIGAAHRRQGKPCQDASLAKELSGPGGARLQLLAVADGHGSSRSWLSQRGSALACQAAEAAVAEAVAGCPLADSRAWGELLAGGLAASVHSRWREGIAADWAQQHPRPAMPLEPVTYGCTLGLVLLAPHWWGCTGLGDWDLVAVDRDGGARLLSEEPSLGPHNGGEATASLCLPQGEALWAPRAQLQPLAAQPQLRALVLSTDGVRKSCASDADFLALCGQVIDLQSPQELADGLEQITLQLHHIGVIDGVLFMERTDEFTIRGRAGSAPVVGVLEFEGDLIKTWREYYDRAHLLKAMGLVEDFDAKTR